MAEPEASPHRASNRRYAAIAAAFVLVLLLVVFGSLFYACGETPDPVGPAATPEEEAAPLLPSG